MAQISIVNKSYVFEAQRFDAEYFKPFNLKYKKLITLNKFSLMENLEKFIIPFIKKSKQNGIAEKILESHKLREESKQLLEDAKRMVEEEIDRMAEN